MLKQLIFALSLLGVVEGQVAGNTSYVCATDPTLTPDALFSYDGVSFY